MSANVWDHVLAKVECNSAEIKIALIPIKKMCIGGGVHSATIRVPKNVTIVDKQTCCEAKEIWLRIQTRRGGIVKELLRGRRSVIGSRADIGLK